MKLRRGWSGFLAVLTLAWCSIAAASDAQSGEGAPDGRTPPRLSYTNGQVSYWRPGAPDWVGAPLNVPLAAGDELYTGPDGTLEIQVGPRAWVRAWAATSLGVVNHEPDYLQLKLTNGHATLDVRALEPGHTLELSTPNAAFTIERPGYYRASVTAERTSFMIRRGGAAVATPLGGPATVVSSTQELVVEGSPAPAVTVVAAADLDAWDRWNYARTDALSAAASASYVSPGVYGTADLDQHGTWQVVQTYGNVWVPRGVPAGWAPYTMGSWIRDPYYGWTWVDSAPWGWAPYHYGRWVHVRGFWAWAPGPLVVRPIYAPALVAFFAGPGITVSIGGPVVGWCALGWGEPIVPWWGRPGFVGVPSWRGWGGPRVVNNVVVHNTTVVNAKNITVYSNARVKDAVVAVNRDHFGGKRVADHRLRPADVRHVEPALPAVAATPASLVPAGAAAAVKPAPDVIGRQVVTKPREPRKGARPGDTIEPGRTVREVPGASVPGAQRPVPGTPGAPSATRPSPRRTEPLPSAGAAAPQPAKPAVPSVTRPMPRQTEPLSSAGASAPRPGAIEPRLPAPAPSPQPKSTAPAPPAPRPRQPEPRQVGAPPVPGSQQDQLGRQRVPDGVSAGDADRGKTRQMPRGPEPVAPGRAPADPGTGAARASRPAAPPVPPAVQVRPENPRPARPDAPPAAGQGQREPARPGITEPVPQPPGRPTSQAIPIPRGGQGAIQQRDPSPTGRPLGAPATSRPDQRVMGSPAAPAPRGPAPTLSPRPEPGMPRQAVETPGPRMPQQVAPQRPPAEPRSQRAEPPARQGRRTVEPAPGDQPGADRGQRGTR